MKELKNIGARPAGAQQESRGNSLDQLERNLSIAIAERKGPFHYNELVRVDGRSKVKAIRSADGTIDILGTFMKAREGLCCRGSGL